MSNTQCAQWRINVKTSVKGTENWRLGIIPVFWNADRRHFLLCLMTCTSLIRFWNKPASLRGCDRVGHAWRIYVLLPHSDFCVSGLTCWDLNCSCGKGKESSPSGPAATLDRSWFIHPDKQDHAWSQHYETRLSHETTWRTAGRTEGGGATQHYLYPVRCCKLLCCNRSSLRADRLVEKSTGREVSRFQLMSSFSRKDKEKKACGKNNENKQIPFIGGQGWLLHFFKKYFSEFFMAFKIPTWGSTSFIWQWVNTSTRSDHSPAKARVPIWLRLLPPSSSSQAPCGMPLGMCLKPWSRQSTRSEGS